MGERPLFAGDNWFGKNAVGAGPGTIWERKQWALINPVKVPQSVRAALTHTIATHSRAASVRRVPGISAKRVILPFR